MKKFFLLLLITSCAHKRPTPPEEDLVSLRVALDQAQASYLRGCVEGQKKLKVPFAFNGCRDMSLFHRQELETIMGLTISSEGKTP